MRQTIRDLIVGTPAVTVLVPTERWFGAGVVLDTPDKPFGVLRWLAPVRGSFSSVFANQLRVDVHDTRGSYEAIDAVLVEIYNVLSGVSDLLGADGRITQCDYLGHSGDQEDPDYRSNYKFSSWQIIGRAT